MPNRTNNGLHRSQPGEVRNPLGINGRGRMGSLIDEMRRVGGEEHQIRKPDGTVEIHPTFNRYVGVALKRMLAEVFESVESGERKWSKGLDWYYRKAFEIWIERMAPMNEAGEAMDGLRTLTVTLSRERPVEVIDVTPVEQDNGNG